MQKLLLIAALVPFAVLTGIALWQHGYLGIFTLHMQSSAGLQVLVDLAIALVLVLTWMWHDAKRLGRNPWPWIVATFALGSFGPLVYLLTRKSERAAEERPKLERHKAPVAAG